MKVRIGVAVITGALAIYLLLTLQRAWVLVTSGNGVGIAMGSALIVFPIVGAWAVWREISFGVRADGLGRLLETEQALPAEELTVRPSGRVLRDEADAVFPRYREAVEQAPDDWRAWYRLGLAYDASGDRRRARHAIRQAIALERASR